MKFEQNWLSGFIAEVVWRADARMDGRTEARTDGQQTKSDHNSSSWAELRWAKKLPYECARRDCLLAVSSTEALDPLLGSYVTLDLESCFGILINNFLHRIVSFKIFVNPNPNPNPNSHWKYTIYLEHWQFLQVGNAFLSWNFVKKP